MAMAMTMTETTGMTISGIIVLTIDLLLSEMPLRLP